MCSLVSRRRPAALLTLGAVSLFFHRWPRAAQPSSEGEVGGWRSALLKGTWVGDDES